VCYVAYVGRLLPKFRDKMSLPSSRERESKKESRNCNLVTQIQTRFQLRDIQISWVSSVIEN